MMANPVGRPRTTTQTCRMTGVKSFASADRSALMFVCALGYIGADTLSDAANNYFGGRR